MRLPRIINRPAYLKEYYCNLDLRTITQSQKKPIPKTFKFKKDDTSEFIDWWGWALLNIRSKMAHTVSKNFSLTICIVNPTYIARLFAQFEERKKKRNLRIRINGKKYLAETHSWRFNDLQSILPHDSDKKIYQNSCKEFVKLTLTWIRF